MEARVTNEEELLKKHRQERKDLQARVQSLKKTAPKGKKKKEVLEDIMKMEQDLDEKQSAELSAIESDDRLPVREPSEEVVNVQKTVDEEDAEEPQAPVKITRAQKRRNKKADDSREREKRISEQEERNKQGPRALESNAINEALKSMGLVLHDIPADGNCLYCAVSHQLEVTGREASSVATLRKQTANFMREHQEDFVPFMYNDSDEPLDEEQFKEYCKSVESSKLWGSQLELRALSNILECPIKIIQAVGQPTVQGETFSGPPLTLTYHRHLYRLGEHYNSTVEVLKDN